MKKLLIILVLLLSLAACQEKVQVIPDMEYSHALTETADVLGIDLSQNTANVLRAIIYQEEDFNWWAEQNGYIPLDDYVDDDLFQLFLNWSWLPEDQKRPVVTPPPIVVDPDYWDNPPAVIYNEGYWTEWNLNYDYFIHHTNYVYVFVRPDATSVYIGNHPNGSAWDEAGIPIPADKKAFNDWFTEAQPWAIQYYLDHFVGENADYQLPAIPE